jgi:hypothetical protein
MAQILIYWPDFFRVFVETEDAISDMKLPDIAIDQLNIGTKRVGLQIVNTDRGNLYLDVKFIIMRV